jgi:Rad3-related DNA helicase
VYRAIAIEFVSTYRVFSGSHLMKKQTFKLPSPGEAVPSTPEALFRDLRQRSANIKHLWAHQADLLREYVKHSDKGDIALELPTGAGKTLVGLLIAEYQRRVHVDRVLYLCPTRQLAYQVGKQAGEYGIRASVLVGPQQEFAQESYTAYAGGQSIGITTYSGVFNTNPYRLSDATVLVLDDAHAAENYVSSLWTVDIDRAENEELYLAVLDTLSDKLRSNLVESLKAEPKERFQTLIDTVPLPYFWERSQEIGRLIDEKLQGKAAYPWKMIREHLLLCNLFLSPAKMSLRPLIPPTLTHKAFANAKQRVYMSATLGEGGELERIFGIRTIHRLPVPAGWETQGSGRRLILFPNHSLDQKQATQFVGEAISTAKRTLVLCPSTLSSEYLLQQLEEYLTGMVVLQAADIEQSLSPFTDQDRTVLVLTARYDGIDLPDDACRQEVIAGLPGATNLQEQFFLDRLGAHALLRDRIRTRISQAVGRCTRNSNDYAAILLLGEDLLDFCTKREVRAGMHPELQAELEFGLTNSEVNAPEELAGKMSLFFEHGDDWDQAETAIQARRDALTKAADPLAETLRKVASTEVNFVYHLFSSNKEAALLDARAASDALSGAELKPYRAWWYYLAGSLAWSRARDGVKGSKELATDMFTRAAETAITVSWFSELATMEIGNPQFKSDTYLGYAVEAIQKVLTRLGTVGPRFEREMELFQTQINSGDHAVFCLGLKSLGEFVGFSSDIPGANADPDNVWALYDRQIVFEVKIEESPNDLISVSTCREASGHLRWAAEHRKGFKQTEAVLICLRKTLDKSARPHADQIHYVHVESVRALAQRVVSVLRQLRAASPDFSDEMVRENILKKLSAENLDPKSLFSFFTQNRVKDLSVKP